MPEFEYRYANLSERKAQIALAEGRGLVMLHDTFDSDWRPGDEPHGTMIFTDVMPLSAPVVTPRDLGKELDSLKSTVNLIRDKVGI